LDICEFCKNGSVLISDDSAIRIIRGFIISFSMLAVFILVFGFQIFPGPFYIFFHAENLSVQSFEKSAPGTSIYFLPGICASIVNTACKIHSLFLKSGSQQWADRFSYSMGASIISSLAMLLFAVSTFVNRFCRMVLIYPLLMFTFLVKFVVEDETPLTIFFI